MAWEPVPAIALSIVLLTVLVVPTPSAVATHRPPCSEVTVADAVEAGPLYARTVQDRYQLWQEANDVPGLQNKNCTTQGGEHVGQDVRLADLPNDVSRAYVQVSQAVCDVLNAGNLVFMCPHEIIRF